MSRANCSVPLFSAVSWVSWPARRFSLPATDQAYTVRARIGHLCPVPAGGRRILISSIALAN